MQYSYNFTFDKFIYLIKKNFPYGGEEGIKKDAQILYYFLMQKYDCFRIGDLVSEMMKIPNLPAVDYDSVLSDLAITKITPSK